jgi:DtxR family Mn-dependent transcriptional regulator
MAEPESVWRQFEANEITHSAAHYLLAIATLAEHAGEAPRAADVARHLDVSRAAVSLQLRSLREHDLVEIGRDRRLRLTGTGADLVGRIASKRRVLRVFFREVLGVPETVAELDACKMEHLISEASSGALVRLLRFLRSGHPAAEEALEAFARVTDRCPPGRRCDLCTEVCLLRAGSSP